MKFASPNASALSTSRNIACSLYSLHRIGTILDNFGLVPFGSDQEREKTPQIFACAEALSNKREIKTRSPAQFPLSTLIDVDTLNLDISIVSLQWRLDSHTNRIVSITDHVVPLWNAGNHPPFKMVAWAATEFPASSQ